MGSLQQTQRRTGLYLIVTIVSITILSAVMFGSRVDYSKTLAVPITQNSEIAPVDIYEQTPWVPELPVRLVIPAISVDAVIQHVGLAPDGSGEMDVPSNVTDVAWYKEGVRPGARGSAVIAGHVSEKGVPEGVFFNLHTLSVGDEVVVMSEERIEDIFVVVKVVTYDYDAPTEGVFLTTGGRVMLNLITCSGEWLPDEKRFSTRTVVFTEQRTDVE